MKTCKNCGTLNDDKDLFCSECGTRLEESPKPEPTPAPEPTPSPTPASTPSTPTVNVDAAVETISEIADKTKRGARDLAEKINATVSETLENQKAKANSEAQQEIARAQKTKATTKKSATSGTKYMSSTELWSWLQKSSKRQHFFTEEENTLTQDDYMERLSQKISDNNVPASVFKRHIQWDRSSLSQDICFVQPVSDAVNPLSCLIQFNHVGKFTFVEEKTFITPPDLPKVPEKKVRLPGDLVEKSAWMLRGGLVAVAGLLLFLVHWLLAIAAIVIGCGLAWIGYSAQQKLEALREHNRNCDRQELAWSAAWDNWENSIFLHSFQENVNGQISRIYDAVFECIKQLNGELFTQQESAVDEESQSMNELEELINRRKATYR